MGWKGKEIERERSENNKPTESTAKRFPAKDLLNENNTLELLFIGEDIQGLGMAVIDSVGIFIACQRPTG